MHFISPPPTSQSLRSDGLFLFLYVIPPCRFKSIHSKILYIVWIIQVGWNCDIIMINNILKFSQRVVSRSLRYHKQHLVYVYLIIELAVIFFGPHNLVFMAKKLMFVLQAIGVYYHELVFDCE